MGAQEISMIWLFSKKTNAGSYVMKEKFLPYKLIGDM